MSDIPKAVWEGSFFLGDLEMKCAVLDNGQRIIDAESVYRFLNGEFGDKRPTDAEIIEFSKWQRKEASEGVGE